MRDRAKTENGGKSGHEAPDLASVRVGGDLADGRGVLGERVSEGVRGGVLLCCGGLVLRGRHSGKKGFFFGRDASAPEGRRSPAKNGMIGANIDDIYFYGCFSLTSPALSMAPRRQEIYTLHTVESGRVTWLKIFMQAKLTLLVSTDLNFRVNSRQNSWG